MIGHDQVLPIAIGLFNKCAALTTAFVVPMALIRVAYANVTGGEGRAYTEVFKGVVLYFILIHTFEPLLGILLDLPEAFGLSRLNPEPPVHGARAQSETMLPSAVLWTLESVASVIYYVAVFLNYAFTVIMSAIAPIMFLLGALFGIGFGVTAFMSLLIVVSSWPIVWVACDQLHTSMKPLTDSGLGALVFEIVILTLKTVAPLTLAYFGAVSSPVGRSLRNLSMHLRQ